jgi:hypothetical protein
MKTNWKSGISGIMIVTTIMIPGFLSGQNQKTFIKKYLTELPSASVKNDLRKYRMTAVYTNRDLYGKFTGKTKITGDYTWGLEKGQVRWNNVRIAGSNSFSEPFPEGKKQEYMENITYVPSSDMLKEDAFKNFPASAENVFARNLIWDMSTIEGFAWNYSDSLQLNRKYVLKEGKGEFDMGNIGTYNHNSIEVCWTGISAIGNKLCAVIEYRAVDNILSLSMEQLNSKGTEQYWGTTWIDLETRQIEYAEMYGGTIQEIEVKGFKDKFLVKTIRELWVEKIQ